MNKTHHEETASTSIYYSQQPLKFLHAHWLLLSIHVSTQTHEFIMYAILTRRATADKLIICYCKKQIDVC